MPTADGKPTAEDIVALLQTKPSAFSLASHIDLFAGGLADLVNRVRNLEHASLVAKAGDDKLTAAVADHETRITGLQGDEKAAKDRLDKVEAAPIDVTKRLDDLDKRVRTVEGAVGSTGFQDAKTAPKSAPFVGPDATAPVAHNPSIFGGTAAEPKTGA